MMDATMQAALREQFPDELVGKLPKAGITLDFVGHGAVTDRLLQVDPDWTWEPFATDEHGLPLLDEFGNLWIRLTIGGITRPGVGDGPNMKERIGDAIRNAAMRFGVALDLWIRGNAAAGETHAEQSRRPRSDSSRRIASGGGGGDEHDGGTPEWWRVLGWESQDACDKAHDDLKETVHAAGAVERMRSFRQDNGFPWPMSKADLDACWSELAVIQALPEPGAEAEAAKRLQRAEQVAQENGTSVSEAQSLAARAQAMAEKKRDERPEERERKDVNA